MSDWEKGFLSDMITDPITYGIVQPGDFRKDGVPLIRGKDYMQGWVGEGEMFRVDPDLHEKYKRSKVTKGDILLSIAGYVGETVIVPKWIKEANITQTSARIRCDEKILSTKFLFYFLNSNEGREITKKFSKGSAQSGLNLSDIGKFEVPVPPLPEQKKISEILSGIDELIENLESKIQKLLILQEGMKNDLLSRGYGHKDFRESEIGMIPKSWEVKCLRVICEKISDRDHTTPIYVNPNEGIPIISPTNLNSDMELDLSKIKYVSKEAHLKNQKKTDLMPDDIIFSRIGAALGKSYLIKKSFYDFSILHSICQIRVKQNLVNPNYLLWQMRKSFFQNSLWLGVQSIGVPDLGLNEIGKLKVPICSLKEQKVITNYLDKMHLQILQIRKRLTQTKSLKKSIMKELLTGKVRVQVN